MGRPAINGSAMSAAERKARARALSTGAVVGELAEVSTRIHDLIACIDNGRPGLTDADLADELRQALRNLDVARVLVAR